MHHLLAFVLFLIAAFSDLWVSRATGRVPLRPELFEVYDADETPRALPQMRLCQSTHQATAPVPPLRPYP